MLAHIASINFRLISNSISQLHIHQVFKDNSDKKQLLNNFQNNNSNTINNSMTMEENDELAEGMKRKLDKFDVSLNNLDATLKPFLNISSNDIQDKIPDPLLKARLDLMVAYSINSLFWAYLTTQGVNPKVKLIML